MNAQTGIKVKDIAFARLRSPDLDVAEEFLTHFGLIKVERTATHLYMRGTDPAQYIHVTERGDPKFIGLAYYSKNEDDLACAARLPGASGIENLDSPGGGKRVRLTEPNGYQIEIVHGIAEHEAIEVPRQLLNVSTSPLARPGELLRLPKGPTLVKRIAHGVIGSPHVVETVTWFRENLGLISSDDVYAGPKDNIIGSFNRCDCGDDYVDHHAFACMNTGERIGLHHISFEVHDIDAVFAGHDYLSRLGKYEQLWGVGRHTAGSQVFDYWADPWGRAHEHWADTDRLNARSGSVLGTPDELLESQWGAPVPEVMMTCTKP